MTMEAKKEGAAALPLTAQRAAYWTAARCAVFCKTRDRHGALSNMAAGFPLVVAGAKIRTSEALYQACKIPGFPQGQRLVLAQASPISAKQVARSFRDHERPDWRVQSVAVMDWCLRVKLAQNLDAFGSALLATGADPIVEWSAKDAFWGAGPDAPGRLLGVNMLGQLLTRLRGQLRAQGPAAFAEVAPLPLPQFNLLGQPIGVVRAGDGDAPWTQLSVLALASPSAAPADEDAPARLTD